MSKQYDVAAAKVRLAREAQRPWPNKPLQNRPAIYDPRRADRGPLAYRRPQATIRPLTWVEHIVLFIWEAFWLAAVAATASYLF